MKYIKTGILAILIFIFSSGVLLIAAAIITAKSESLPEGMLPLITTAILAVSVFLSVYIVSRRLKEKGILMGLILGMIIFLCVWIISCLVYKNSLITVGGIGKGVAIIAASSLGGILGVNKKSKIKF